MPQYKPVYFGEVSDPSSTELKGWLSIRVLATDKNKEVKLDVYEGVQGTPMQSNLLQWGDTVHTSFFPFAVSGLKPATDYRLVCRYNRSGVSSIDTILLHVQARVRSSRSWEITSDRIELFGYYQLLPTDVKGAKAGFYLMEEGSQEPIDIPTTRWDTTGIYATAANLKPVTTYQIVAYAELNGVIVADFNTPSWETTFPEKRAYTYNYEYTDNEGEKSFRRVNIRECDSGEIEMNVMDMFGTSLDLRIRCYPSGNAVVDRQLDEIKEGKKYYTYSFSGYYSGFHLPDYLFLDLSDFGSVFLQAVAGALGDINLDGVTDQQDISNFAFVFTDGTAADWIDYADMNSDAKISLEDLAGLSLHVNNCEWPDYQGVPEKATNISVQDNGLYMTSPYGVLAFDVVFNNPGIGPVDSVFGMRIMTYEAEGKTHLMGYSLTGKPFKTGTLRIGKFTDVRAITSQDLNLVQCTFIDKYLRRTEVTNEVVSVKRVWENEEVTMNIEEGILNVVSNSEIQSICVYNTLSNTVLQSAVNRPDLSSLAKGIYVVKVIFADGSYAINKVKL